MPTNSEKPQARRDIGFTKAMVRARENPQARQDNTQIQAKQLAEFQSGLKPIKKAGDPNGPKGDTPPGLVRGCLLLSETDNVAALAWDKPRNRLAVPNGQTVDIMRQALELGGNEWLVERSIDVGEAVTGVSVYGGAMWVSTATKGIYWPEYRYPANSFNTGGPGLVDGLLWSTAEDSNPDWTGAVYTPPNLFLVEADAAGWEVWDVTSGTPVTDLTQALLGISSLAYQDGQLYVGTSAGVQQYDWVTDNVTPYTTATTPAIVNDTVNDVAATVLSSVPTTNLFDASEDLTDGYWDLKIEVTVTTDTMTDNAVNSIHSVGRGAIVSPLGFITQSARMQEIDNCGWGSIRGDDGVGGAYSATFDIRAGTIVDTFTSGGWTGLFAAIMPHADGGYMVSVSVNRTAGTTVTPTYQMRALAPTPEAYSGTGSKMLCTEMQLEQSATPHNYVPSVTGPTTGSTPSAKQLVNRTNLWTYSEELDNAQYVENGVAVTANVTTAPDGTLTADAVTEDGTNAPHRLSTAAVPPAPTIGDVITYSTYAKLAVGTRDVTIEFDDGAVIARVSFDLVNGVILAETVGTGAIKSVGEGWYRCSATGTAAIGGGVVAYLANTDGTNISYQGDGVSSIYWWGIQYETGSQATPYIPTTDSAATVTDDTGLFVPTWGVATDGGVSEGLDSGAIWDITGQTQFPVWIDFTSAGEILCPWEFQSEAAVFSVLTADITTAGFSRRYYPSTSSSDAGAPKILITAGGHIGLAASGNDIVFGSDSGLTVVTENTVDYFDGVYSWTTTTYNTGGMKQPDGAWADDDSTTPIIGPATLTDNSGQANDGIVTGQITRVKFAGLCTYGVEIEPPNTLELTGTGALSGYVKYGTTGRWAHFKDQTELKYATSGAGSITLTGAEPFTPDYPTSYAMLVMNGIPIDFDSFDSGFDGGFE